MVVGGVGILNSSGFPFPLVRNLSIFQMPHTLLSGLSFPVHFFFTVVIIIVKVNI